MTPEFKQKWLERLTDGSFKQAQTILADDRDSISRCCLGVALAVAAELNLLPAFHSKELYRRNEQIPTDEELKIIGLDKTAADKLAARNDKHWPKDGRYYPDEVLDLVKEIETETTKVKEL